MATSENKRAKLSTDAENASAAEKTSFGKLIGKGSNGKVYLKDRQQRIVRKMFEHKDLDIALAEFQIYRSLPQSCFFPRRESDNLEIAYSGEVMYSYFDVAEDFGAMDLNKALGPRRTGHLYTPLNRKLLIGDLVLAIGQLQESGILHMDLKPDNCLILDDSHLKLIDFGHACQIGEEVELTGSIGYCSPQLLTLSLETAQVQTDSRRRALLTRPPALLHHDRGKQLLPHGGVCKAQRFEDACQAQHQRGAALLHRTAQRPEVRRVPSLARTSEEEGERGHREGNRRPSQTRSEMARHLRAALRTTRSSSPVSRCH